MSNWNNLLAALDAALGFPNKQSSTVKKVGQVYDPKNGEHVITIQYRVKVNPGQFEAQHSMPLLAELNSRVAS